MSSKIMTRINVDCPRDKTCQDCKKKGAKSNTTSAEIHHGTFLSLHRLYQRSCYSASLSAQCFVAQEFCLKHTTKHKMIPLQIPIIPYLFAFSLALSEMS